MAANSTGTAWGEATVQEPGQDAHVLLGVSSRVVIRQPVDVFDGVLVRRPHAERESRTVHGSRHG
jgi:hypothetical protein